LAIHYKLSRLLDDPLERRHHLAEALALEGKYSEAEMELRRVLAVAPEKVGSRDLLAQLLSFRGMFEEAQQRLAKVVVADPEAFRRLTNIKRMTEADRPLIDRMCARAEEPDLIAIPRISVQFALGKAFDDLGDFAQAMRHYEAGNGLKATSARLDRAGLAARYNGLIARFTADKLKHAFASRKHGSAPGDELPVFVVGMPRSGSTLVEQILSSHPAVGVAGELDFWLNRQRGFYAFELEGLEWGTLSRAAEDYLAELRAVAPGALRVVDKGLTNFELLWLLRLTFPYARIVHCRRHPVDTCLAIFFQLLGGRYDYAYDRGDLVFYYRQYERLMQHWQAVLPGDRFIEVNYEALIADQEAETRRLIAFCGLDWDDACLAPERNRRIVRTSSLWQVRQPVYKRSVARWRNYEPWLGELRELLPTAQTTEVGHATGRSF
jgi:tetratricopeptide (TPR) repeat protein